MWKLVDVTWVNDNGEEIPYSPMFRVEMTPEFYKEHVRGVEYENGFMPIPRELKPGEEVWAVDQFGHTLVVGKENGISSKFESIKAKLQPDDEVSGC